MHEHAWFRERLMVPWVIDMREHADFVIDVPLQSMHSDSVIGLPLRSMYADSVVDMTLRACTCCQRACSFRGRCAAPEHAC